jgi:SAM-dependent methyltransferase
MQQAFRKDLSHSTWDEVYARQVQRAELVPAWIEALGLNTGDRVLDVGSGPGYVSLGLAERIGPGGMVYAVDRSRDALAHLERLQKERNIQQIQRMAADVGTLENGDLHPDSALISMVLHHADDPAGVLRNVHRLLPARARGRGRIPSAGAVRAGRAARISPSAGAGAGLVRSGRLYRAGVSAAEPRALYVCCRTRGLNRPLTSGCFRSPPARGCGRFCRRTA